MIGKTNAKGGIAEPVPKIKTVSGSVISISDALAQPAVSIIADINAVQNLNGYDSPWPAGGGKNKFDPSEAQNNKWVNNTTGAIDDYNGYWVTGFIPVKAGDVVRCPAKSTVRNAWYNTDKSQATYVSYNGGGGGITAPADGFIVITVKDIAISFGSDFIVTLNDADLTYVPYANICPISGWSNINVYREAQYDAGATPYATINLNGTVYGGSLDVTTGVLTVDRAIVDLGTLTWVAQQARHFYYTTGIANVIERPATNNDVADIMCSTAKSVSANAVDVTSGALIGIVTNGNIQYRFDEMPSTATEFKTAVTGHMLLYSLATPTTVQLTSTQVQMLLGNNTLWADSGDSTLQYWARR